MPGMTLGSVVLGGCAHRGSCPAIGAHAEAPPAALECAAASGDKFAQLALGIRLSIPGSPALVGEATDDDLELVFPR